VSRSDGDDGSIRLSRAGMVYAGRGHQLHALRSVDLTVGRGEFLAVIGPSGCGKTTLLKLVAGLLMPTSGTISVFGGPPERALRGGRVGFVFQRPVLLDWRTVRRNVLLPTEVLPRRATNGRGIDRRLAESRVDQLIELVGLHGFENAYPHELSGGMQSRVALARALCFEPDILLMDEPFGDLDELTRTRLNLELLQVHASTGATVVFVTHSIAEAVFLADRVAVLSNRPGEVLCVIDITLGRPRGLDVQGSDRFAAHEQELRESLGIAGGGA
jgi:NitT/TauT family transport system ATP-binding protein